MHPSSVNRQLQLVTSNTNLIGTRMSDSQSCSVQPFFLLATPPSNPCPSLSFTVFLSALLPIYIYRLVAGRLVCSRTEPADPLCQSECRQLRLPSSFPYVVVNSTIKARCKDLAHRYGSRYVVVISLSVSKHNVMTWKREPHAALLPPC